VNVRTAPRCCVAGVFMTLIVRHADDRRKLRRALSSAELQISRKGGTA
jgi:hypothetical protein